MSIDVTTEKRFESDIEEFFLSATGRYTHNYDTYDPQLGVYKDTLLRFVQKTQPKEWKRFLLQNKVDPERKFCLAFNNACDLYYAMASSTEEFHLKSAILDQNQV